MFATVLQPTSLKNAPKKTPDQNPIIPRTPDATRAKQSRWGRGWHSQQRLDIKVVSSEDNLEEHLLIDSDELLVPLADISRPLAGLVLVLVRIGRRQGLSAMMLAVLKNLKQRSSA